MDHEIVYVEAEVTITRPAKPNVDGDIKIDWDVEPTVVSAPFDTFIHCLTCDRELFSGDYASHGISKEWEPV